MGARRRSAVGGAAAAALAVLLLVAQVVLVLPRSWESRAVAAPAPSLRDAAAVSVAPEDTGDEAAERRLLQASRADRSGRAGEDVLDDGIVGRPAISSPVPGAPLTAHYGDGGSHWRHRHTGLDFNGNTGDPVLAVTDGTVTSVVHHPAYGLLLMLRRDDGVVTWYAHLSKVLVPSGQVHAGDRIALMGNSGNSTGSHLHLEVRVHGVPTDPEAFLWGPVPGTPAAPADWACAVYAGC